MKQNVAILRIITITITLICVLFLTNCINQLDQGPPTATILNPVSGDIVSGIVPVVVTGTDEKDVVALKILVDGVDANTIDGDVGVFNWDTGPIADNQNHHISAYAIDDNDNIGPATTVTVNVFAAVPGTPLPQTVTIQNPIQGQTVSGTVNVATAVTAGANNPIDSVAFFIDGVRQFSDTSFPYIFSWETSGLVNGSLHTIFAIAYDSGNFDVVSPAITVTVTSNVVGNNTAPIVTLEHPLNNQTVTGIVNVLTRVTNVANNPIDSVLFLIDGQRSFTFVGELPFIFPWDTQNLVNGTLHNIISVVFDRQGFNISSNAVSVIVNSNVVGNNTAPVVTIAQPLNNQVVSGVVSIVTLVTNVATNPVDSVLFLIDGERSFTYTGDPPYVFPWETGNLVNGTTHTIISVVYDREGFNVSSNVISVSVSSNVIEDIIAPVPTFVYPAPAGGQIFSVSATSSITAVVDAVDNVGVTNVEFYIDGVLMGSDNTALYEYFWDFAGFALGTHTIFVRAFDAAGNIGVALTAVRLDP